MNIFFYPAALSKNVPQCFTALQSCIAAQELILLPGGCRLHDTHCLHMRSGDILILYAKNNTDIEELLTQQDDFEAYRILIVLHSDCTPHHRDLAYKLRPRFLTDCTDLIELSTVVMNILLRNDDRIWSSATSQEGTL